jgi:hypothetical protein
MSPAGGVNGENVAYLKDHFFRPEPGQNQEQNKNDYKTD